MAANVALVALLLALVLIAGARLWVAIGDYMCRRRIAAEMRRLAPMVRTGSWPIEGAL